jgi:hypothetical protein
MAATVVMYWMKAGWDVPQAVTAMLAAPPDQAACRRAA